MIKKNKSFCYLYPLLGIPKEYTNALINSYMKFADSNNNTLINEIYLVFDSFYMTTTEMTNISKLHNYVELQMCGNKVVLKFTIDAKYLSDIKFFYQGRYSLFSSDTKNIILKHWFEDASIEIVTSQPIYKVLYPTDNLISNLAEKLGVKKIYEVSSKPNLLDETFFSNIEFLSLVI